MQKNEINRLVAVLFVWIMTATTSFAKPANDKTGASPPTQNLPAAPETPVDVFIGAYWIRIPSLSFRDNQWTVDAYIWFQWKGKLDPLPQDAFELCNGNIEKIELTDAKKVKVKRGNVEEEYDYACVRIQAVITNIWNVSKYPFDVHKLALMIEDKKRESSMIRYLVAEGTSGIDESCQIPGWRLGLPSVESLIHKYPTNYGDPEQAKDSELSYSRLALTVPMTRTSPWWYAFKVLNGLYIAVFIGILSFLVKPSRLDVRFGAGVGAVFAAIASQYVTAGSLPETGQLTLVDTLFTLGTAIIFFSLVESTIVLHLVESGRVKAAKWLDGASLLITTCGYLALNVWLIR